MTEPTHAVLPYEAASAADAVAQFVRDYCSFGEGAAPFKEEIIAAIRLFVTARFAVDRPEVLEIEFHTDGAGYAGARLHSALSAPLPLAKYIGVGFGELAVQYNPSALQPGALTYMRGKDYVLQVTPTLVTFAGHLVWNGYGLAP